MRLFPHNSARGLNDETRLEVAIWDGRLGGLDQSAAGWRLFFAMNEARHHFCQTVIGGLDRSPSKVAADQAAIYPE